MHVKSMFVRLLIVVGLLFASVAPAGAEVAVVLNSADETVSLIDTNTYTEIQRYPVGKEPHHLMATTDDSHLIVASALSNELVMLDPVSGQIIRRVPKISDPYQIAFSPDKKWFVANSLRLDRVDIYNAADFSIAKRIPAPKAPSHLAFDRASQYVFCLLYTSPSPRD